MHLCLKRAVLVVRKRLGGDTNFRNLVSKVLQSSASVQSAKQKGNGTHRDICTLLESEYGSLHPPVVLVVEVSQHLLVVLLRKHLEQGSCVGLVVDEAEEITTGFGAREMKEDSVDCRRTGLVKSRRGRIGTH